MWNKVRYILIFIIFFIAVSATSFLSYYSFGFKYPKDIGVIVMFVGLAGFCTALVALLESAINEGE